jgi:hypothetical protein
MWKKQRYGETYQQHELDERLHRADIGAVAAKDEMRRVEG